MSSSRIAVVVGLSLAACAAEPDLPTWLPDGAEIHDGKVVVEGDMVIGSEEDLHDDPEPLSIGVDGSGKRWPGGVIPYTIHPGLPQQQRVTDAIAHWEAKTSIDFVPRTNQDDYVEFTNGTWCHADVGRKGGKQHVWLATSKSDEAIRGMAIASNDWVYTWYADGMVSAGTSTDLDNRRTQYPYRLPPGYQPDDIVEIAIAGNDRVYTWYTDRKVSVGTTDDLDAHEPPHGNYAIPGGRSPAQIVGIAIGDGDQVYAWYSDGMRSKGWSQDLASDVPPQSFGHHPDHPPDLIRGMDIASSDRVYTWYGASGGIPRRLTAGQSRGLDAHLPPTSYAVPSNCTTGTVIHEIGHTVGLKHEQSRCDRDDHVNVYYGNVQPGKEGNFDTECLGHTDYGAYDFNSVMHYSSGGFSKNGSPTLLRHGTLGASVSSGLYVLDSAIASDSHVYTWWSDGTVTAGTSSNLEFHRSRYPYTLAPGYWWWDVVGIAIARSTDRVYTFYVDGKVSVGTTADLDAHVAPYDFELPGNRTASQILAVGISADDTVYAWYTDGKVSSGTSNDLGADRAPYPYVFESGYGLGDVMGIDISPSDTVYAWHYDGMTSRGTSQNLGAVGSPYPYRGRGILLTSKSQLSAGDVAGVEAMY